MQLGRLLTAMVTPFDNEGKVDVAQAKRLAAALLDSGSDGLVIAGTTGECPTLGHEEKLRLFTEIRSAVPAGAFIAGTGTYNTAESIELSQEAERIGADALLLTTPYYSRPPQEGIFRHFEAIANAVSIPCIIYNIPSRTAVNVTAETMLRLAQVPNIAGVKESSGDLRQIATIIDGAPDGFHVWSGDDELVLPILAIGGYGGVAVASHLIGRQMRDMIQAHIDGRVDEAARLHCRLLPLMSTLMTAAPNPIAVKYALNQIGFRCGEPRLPLVEPDAAAADRIMTEVRRQQIDLPVPV